MTKKTPTLAQLRKLAKAKGIWLDFRWWNAERIEVELWMENRLTVLARFYGPTKFSVLKMVKVALSALPDADKKVCRVAHHDCDQQQADGDDLCTKCGRKARDHERRKKDRRSK